MLRTFPNAPRILLVRIDDISNEPLNILKFATRKIYTNREKMRTVQLISNFRKVTISGTTSFASVQKAYQLLLI